MVSAVLSLLLSACASAVPYEARNMGGDALLDIGHHASASSHPTVSRAGVNQLSVSENHRDIWTAEVAVWG